MPETVSIYQNIDLSLTSNVIPPIVHVRQYDNLSRKVQCSLYANHLEYAVPQNITIMYIGTRPDGRVFQYSSGGANSQFISLSSGNKKVSITITEFMTAVAGKYPVDIVLVDGQNILGSFSFYLSVESAAANIE